MKLATLACLAALSLVGPAAYAAPGETAKPAAAPVTPAPPPGAAKAGQPGPAPDPQQPAAAQAAAPAAALAQAAPRPASSARTERRRRSYAACNRASHQRGLRGGKRRRFLIRCRLGYERTHGQPAQPSAGQPVQPGRKP